MKNLLFNNTHTSVQLFLVGHGSLRCLHYSNVIYHSETMDRRRESVTIPHIIFSSTSPGTTFALASVFYCSLSYNGDFVGHCKQMQSFFGYMNKFVPNG